MYFYVKVIGAETALMARLTDLRELVYLSIFLVTVVDGAIIQRPMNVATDVGGQTVFNCTSDITSAIAWLYAADCNAGAGTPLTENNCDLITSYASHHRTEKPGGFVCNLIVFNALLPLGGCYVCIDGIVTGSSFQAMLIVIDPNAIITTNSTEPVIGEDVMISSNISYRGPSIPQQLPPLPPSFYWTLKSNPSHSITNHPGLTTHTTASSYIVVPTPPSKFPSYVCNLFFNLPNYVPPNCATNAPTYRISWETPNYYVSYPPENLNISGNFSSCLSDPVVLTCNASGYPTPAYKWFNLTSGDVMSESNTVIIQSAGSYQCIASNTIRNLNYNASAVANVDDCPSLLCVNLGVLINLEISDPVCITSLVVVIFLGLNLLFLIGFIIYYSVSESGRNNLNDRFPWLRKTLPCKNYEGCKCYGWIFPFIILAMCTAVVFFPSLLCMANCCKKNRKKSQGVPRVEINPRQEAYVCENENSSYEALQKQTAKSTMSVYEELRGIP